MQVQIDNDVFNQETWFAVEHEVLLFVFDRCAELTPGDFVAIAIIMFVFNTFSRGVVACYAVYAAYNRCDLMRSHQQWRLADISNYCMAFFYNLNFQENCKRDGFLISQRAITA